jgi:hypothetical protein
MQKGWKAAAVTIVLCGSLFGMNLAGAQNPTAPATKATVKETAAKEAGTNATAKKETAPTKKAAKKSAGRLPAHFSDIVTEEQKVEIYSIQAGYAVKISALANQIKEIQAQQNAEIEALLNEEQKEKLKVAKETAAAKRKQKIEAAAEAKAEESKKVATE